jgi:8-oxo-dGTP pyrophosphatase MutT (NUDIX family)
LTERPNLRKRSGALAPDLAFFAKFGQALALAAGRGDGFQAGRVQAGVCVPLHLGAEGLEVWAIRRADGLRHHAREIAFPGGKQEPWDRDLADTALRELEEELGIRRDQVRVLGRLASVPTATSLFTLNPIVGRVDDGARPTPDPGEVAELIRTPLARFFTGGVPYRAVEFMPGRLSPIFDFEPGSMYGASAHVLEELLLAYGDVAGLSLPEPARADTIPWL